MTITTDSTTEEWEEYVRQANAEIDAAFRRHITRRTRVAVMPPPTRSETIKAAWERIGPSLAAFQGHDSLLVTHDLGVVAPIVFEIKDYGRQTVVEAEGVIVQRL